MRVRAAQLSFCLLVASTADAAATPVSVVPAPQQIVQARGTARLDPTWTIRVTTNDPGDLHAASLITAELAKPFLSRPPDAPQPERTITFRQGRSAGSADSQAYVLRVTPSAIDLIGATAQGRFYAAQTLRQLMRQSSDGRIPCLTVRDRPALAYRGVSEDISRGQMPTLQAMCRTIDQLAYYKLNLYQLYIEDTFVFASAPEVGGSRPRLTAATLSQVVEHGRRNHVTVVPILQTVGHQERLLSLPSCRKYAEFAPVTSARTPWPMRFLPMWKREEGASSTPWSFAIGRAAARRFVLGLVDDVAGSAPLRFVHLGGDEAWDVGRGLSRKVAEQRGVGRLYVSHFNALAQHLLRRHRQEAMIYADALLAHPEVIPDLDSTIVVVDWQYNPEDTLRSPRALKRAGVRRLIVSAGMWNWRAFHPDYERSFQNIAQCAMTSKAEGAMGCVVGSWGDGGGECLQSNNWPGYAYLASEAWTQRHTDRDEFLRRYVMATYGVAAPALEEAERVVGWQGGVMTGFHMKQFYGPLRRGPRPQIWIRRMNELDSTMTAAMGAIDREWPRVRAHKDRLDGLRHSARRLRYLANRERQLAGYARTDAAVAAAGASAHHRGSLLAEVDALTAEYASLWLRTNERASLETGLSRLRQQRLALADALRAAIPGE